MVSKVKELRRGWTTGACAAAAAKAACAALLAREFPDPVQITLPGGAQPAFALATWQEGDGWASAGIVKDAGDDPDVTHGALVTATVRRGAAGSGIVFKAGPGVGTVTRAGLPIPPDEPAINPMPRRMIAAAVAEVAGDDGAFEIEISVRDGEKLAARTLNPRLGIVGGISILGTTGIVIPFSCAAWIHSIHRGIDVARAAGVSHVLGSTGSTSESAARKLHGLPEIALIDMGDFVGGMLKYLRKHPVERVTVAGGMAKMTKLAQGRLDLHSKRGLADFDELARIVEEAGGPAELVGRIPGANTVAEVFTLAAAEGINLGSVVAQKAWRVAAAVLDHEGIELEVLVFDRSGVLLDTAPFHRSDHAPRPLKRR